MENKNLPFYYKTHEKNDNGGFPKVLPFYLYFDKELKLLRQKSTESLISVLKNVYLQGSLVDGSVSSESGFHYVNPLMKYILSNINLNKDSKILEIGFGEGNFLSAFNSLGIKNLTGIEPGNHNVVSGLEEVNLISDFYPSNKFNDKVDLIFHCLVLEHIEDPFEFLILQKLQLNEDGKIIFFVPNEEPYLMSGDYSSFIHEHFNFFTQESIFLLIKKMGMFIHDISIIGGLIAVTIGLNKSEYFQYIKGYNFDFQIFLKKAEFNLHKVSKFINEFKDISDLVLYVPGRALNFMYLVNCFGPRLVDDSKDVQGKFLPFFENAIESFDSLLQKPPKAILIFSRTFGEKIRDKCESFSQLKECRCLLIEDILDE
jgi:2-polyprenyl-3-methyl-5-hydroxy-6-metoxy-1,4-benzoquinol methylase